MAGLATLAGGLMFGQTTAATNTAPMPGNVTQPMARSTQGPAARRARFMQHMSNYLNLTPQQKTQTREFMANARKESAGLRQVMIQDRQVLADAIKSGDNAKIDQVTKSEAPVMAQLAAIRAHTAEKIYATLTPAQKVKADNMWQWFRTTPHRRG